jgi:small subunit ribosomal protein S6
MPEEAPLYEAMYILPADVDGDEMQEIAQSLKQTAEDAGAEVKADELFGRRRLAYEIDHQRDGIYRVMYFRGTGAAVDALKGEFQVSERIIRGMIVVANPQAIVRPPQRSPQAPAEQGPEGAAAQESSPQQSPEAAQVEADAAEPEPGVQE